MPPGTSGLWIAYAYINDNLSVYNHDWCGRVSAQMHEIGHNYNLDHSGTVTGNEYGDRSGYMGISYPFDDLPIMCCNGPKSWQLGWYATRSVELNDITANGGGTTYVWTGTLVGISDYEQATGDQYVLLKIKRHQMSTDLYVNFNRVSGINSSSQANQDKVIVTQQGEDGGTSSVLTGLTVGQSYIESNFDNINENSNLAIKVEDIDYTSSVWTATVSITYGPGVTGSTLKSPPTNHLSLQEKWNIELPNFVYDDDLGIQLDFNVSDYLNEQNVGFELYEESDCETPIEYGKLI